uniref:Uncharacterized protein n=1 Tax=Cannabis sativa TaxID=3483 RepID=A0A803R4T9_CANSA
MAKQQETTLKQSNKTKKKMIKKQTICCTTSTPDAKSTIFASLYLENYKKKTTKTTLKQHKNK